MSGKEAADVSDEDVIRSYEESIAPGGVMREYLRLSELVCILRSTIFVHGQVIGNDFVNCGEGGVAQSVGCVPLGSDCTTWSNVPDLRQWANELNAWSKKSIAAWEAQPTWKRPPTESIDKDWLGRGGADLIVYGTPATRVPSVVYCRWLEVNCMPKPYPDSLVEYLKNEGISRVIVGHTPHGNCPTVIPHAGLSVIMGDTSYSSMKSDLSYRGDNRGDCVCEIALAGSSCRISGRTGSAGTSDSTESPAHQVVNYYVGEGGDPHIGAVQPISEEVTYEKRFFVKASLAALEGRKSRYLLCRVNGFTNTYQEETKEQVVNVFGSGSVLPRNSSRSRRLTSHGEVFGHSFSGADGDVVEHIFRMCDRDRDTMVTRQELLTACSDYQVRLALTWSFPDACLQDVFAELDANKDGLVSIEEFRASIKGMPGSNEGSRRASKSPSEASASPRITD